MLSEGRTRVGAPFDALRQTLRAILLSFVAIPALAQPPLQTGNSSAQSTSVQTPKDFKSLGKAAGVLIFSVNCASCHVGQAIEGQRAPTMSTLQSLPPEAIYAALTTGKMSAIAHSLADDEKRMLAEFLSGRSLANADSADAAHMSNRCPDDAIAMPPIGNKVWNGWGADTNNRRFRSADSAGLTAEQVTRLRLKWAFGFPLAAQAYSQPTVVGGRLYVGSDSGFVYALDANSGCVYWSFRAEAGIHTAISVGTERSSLHKWAAYFADMHANAYAIDARTGQLLWTTKVDRHPLAVSTGSPTLFNGRLYVPVSSGEEAGSISPLYPCCTFRGSVVALNAASGKQIWKTYTITEEPKLSGKNSYGTKLFGPAGGAVWNSPTIDARERVLYVGTGDGYTVPAAAMTDSILAISLESGKIVWSYQATGHDAWLVACVFNSSAEPCPRGSGPDYDVGTSPILVSRPNGHSLLLGADKKGTITALDPEKRGALVWKMELAETPPTAFGEILFGGAADESRVYYALNSGGITALDWRSGERVWSTPVSSATRPEQSAAVTVIPGVVFSGGLDGVLRAFSTEDGHLMWQVETARTFEAVNGGVAKGGSIGAPGPVIVDGRLYVGSGYIGTRNGMPGNVLLAFAPE